MDLSLYVLHIYSSIFPLTSIHVGKNQRKQTSVVKSQNTQKYLAQTNNGN
ncbi:hypothetical protein Hanom_Chr16g01473281 [Helianthus anomalus]